MNETISWDPSLVKKFSSSNHFKLLNQLRSEVKKYPLNNKKHLKADQTRINNQDLQVKTNVDHKKNISLANYPNKNVDNNTNNSNVSFNNSKNFSIYSQSNDNTIIRQSDIYPSDKSNSNDGSSSLSFKERLNQIDLK